MLAKPCRDGFTRIEFLSIVVIVAVLAATIIPQFSTSTGDARGSNMKVDLQSLRTQLELYKLQHGGRYPDGSNNLEQLTKATDASGAVSVSGLPDATHPFGPYISGGALPAQAISGDNRVRLCADGPGTAVTGTAAAGGGWIYRPATGEIWIDHEDYVNE